MDGLFDWRKYSLAVYDSYSDYMIRKSKHSVFRAVRLGNSLTFHLCFPLSDIRPSNNTICQNSTKGQFYTCQKGFTNYGSQEFNCTGENVSSILESEHIHERQ